MTEQMTYFIYILHRCAEAHNVPNAADLLRDWDNAQITSAVFELCANQRYDDKAVMNAIDSLRATDRDGGNLT